MSNPYADPNADDDIFGAPNRPAKPKGAHKLDGTPCPRCGGRAHHVSMPKDVPASVIDQLSDLLDSAPPGTVADQIVVTTATPNQHLVVDSFLDFIREVSSLNQQGPLIRAVAEIIDEQTGGAVTRRWHVYTAERDLLIYHAVLKMINSIVEGMKAMNAEANKDANTVMDLCNELLKNTLERLHQAQERYKEVCNEEHAIPDEDIIYAGMPANYSPIAQHTMKDWLDAQIEAIRQKN